MPDPVTGLIVGGSQIVGGAIQSRAAGKAAGQQADAAQAGIEEQRRQFDKLQELLAPYVQAGQPALQAQQALLGLRGPEEQAAAVSGLESSPMFQALARQGEQAMLQQASATGGLRGGNLQAALAQFRPQMLAQAIEDQYSKLGGMTTLGQQSAAGVGSAGMQTGGQIAALLQQQGAARAGGTMGRAAPFVNLFNMPAQFVGLQMGMGKTPGFGSLFGGGTPAGGAATGGSGLRPPAGFSFGGP